jgi:FkbM family methyltransferase
MTLKHQIRQLALRAGIDMHRYNAVESAQARLLHQLRTHDIDTVIDVGANDGGYGSLLRQGGYQGTIVSFEPLSAAHAGLLQATAGDPLWHVAPRLALGECAGQARINIAGNSASSSLLPMKGLHADAAPTSRYVGTEAVAVMALDEFTHPALEQARNVLLKIDTQGYEMPVLHGARRWMQRLAGVQLELSVAPLYEGQVLHGELMAHLAAQGLELWNLMPGFVDPASGRMLQFDGVFFRPLGAAPRQ